MKHRTSQLIETLTFDQLSGYFHMPLKEAAPAIGICVTALKRACRRNKISRWPHRKIKSLDRMITALSSFNNASVDDSSSSCSSSSSSNGSSSQPLPLAIDACATDESIERQLEVLKGQREEIMKGLVPDSSSAFNNPFYFLLDLESGATTPLADNCSTATTVSRQPASQSAAPRSPRSPVSPCASSSSLSSSSCCSSSSSVLLSPQSSLLSSLSSSDSPQQLSDPGQPALPSIPYIFLASPATSARPLPSFQPASHSESGTTETPANIFQRSCSSAFRPIHQTQSASFFSPQQPLSPSAPANKAKLDFICSSSPSDNHRVVMRRPWEE